MGPKNYGNLNLDILIFMCKFFELAETGLYYNLFELHIHCIVKHSGRYYCIVVLKDTFIMVCSNNVMGYNTSS